MRAIGEPRFISFLAIGEPPGLRLIFYFWSSVAVSMPVQRRRVEPSCGGRSQPFELGDKGSERGIISCTFGVLFIISLIRLELK